VPASGPPGGQLSEGPVPGGPKPAGGKSGSVGAAVVDSATGLSEADIRGALAGKSGAFNECQSIGKAAGGDFTGTVAVRASIGPPGSVDRMEITSSTTNNPRVDGCVVDALRLIQFPRTQTGGVANIPIEFGQ
jgi:outer membrane biosynthesis protein TonB